MSFTVSALHELQPASSGVPILIQLEAAIRRVVPNSSTTVSVTFPKYGIDDLVFRAVKIENAGARLEYFDDFTSTRPIEEWPAEEVLLLMVTNVVADTRKGVQPGSKFKGVRSWKQWEEGTGDLKICVSLPALPLTAAAGRLVRRSG